MKPAKLFRTTAFFFLLALVLTTLGLFTTFDVFRDYDRIALSDLNHEQLMSLLQLAAARLLVGSAMVATGIGTLVLLFLHQIRRSVRLQKEADALRQRNEEAERLAHHQRLETIGTLTASIAHEFNNLLTPIMGYSLMALEQLPPENEGLYDDILEIYNASQKAKQIISRLSDLSRKNTSMTFHSVSPDELIRHTMDVAASAKPHKVEIRMNLNCWDQRIRANEIQISQMLLNLILNSFHAMERSGGTLDISTSFDDSGIQIQISDTGCGIPADIRDQVFQPFFTTKDPGRGTGLGLAIVAQVVADHQGKILLDSQEGTGTTFTITLPRFAEPEKLHPDP